MRKLAISLLGISAFLLSGCGREFAMNNRAMTHEEATNVLASLPPTTTLADPTAVSQVGLEQAIQEAYKSGKVQLPKGARGAIMGNGGLNLSNLSTLLNLVAQGKGAIDMAQATVQNSSGSPTKAKFSLDTIVMILQAVAPIVAMFAPQYAAVIQAVLVIIPTIKAFIDMFKKPAPPTAWLEFPRPAYGAAGAYFRA